jgi:hypothetical protein
MTDKYVSQYPKPTPYQAELIECLTEECAEVIYECMKAMRFGQDDRAPYERDQNMTNRKKLSKELGELQALIPLLVEAGVVDEHEMARGRQAKPFKLSMYLQHAPSGV